MPIASVILAVALCIQSPIKLSNTFVKDVKATYAVSVKMDMGELMGDITFEALDEFGEVSVKSPGIKMDMGGNIIDAGTYDRKHKFDAFGLTTGLEFSQEKAVIVILCLAGYVPNKEIKLDSLFDIDEKREGYTIKGTGKLLSVTVVEGKKQAKMEYNMAVKPNDEASEGVVKFTSIFDVDSGKLVSSEATLEIDGQTGKIVIKTKK